MSSVFTSRHPALFIAPFALVVSVAAFAHELGHLLGGRLFGAKAEVFSVRIGPKLLGFTDRRVTRRRLSALPIGRYVRVARDQIFVNAEQQADKGQQPESLPAQPLLWRPRMPVVTPRSRVTSAPRASFLSDGMKSKYFRSAAGPPNFTLVPTMRTAASIRITL